MSDRKRDPAIDIARGLAMVLVVFGHSTELFFSPAMRVDGVFDSSAFNVWQFIYSFHMPAFYMISGTTALRLKDERFLDVLKASLALVLFAGLTHLITLPAAIEVDRHLGIDKYGASLLHDALWPVLSLNNYSNVLTWFLASLAMVRIFAYLYVTGNNLGKMTIIGCLFAAALAGDHFNSGIFQIHTILYGVIFFLLGRSFAIRAPLLYKRLDRHIFWVIATLLAVVSLTYNRNFGDTLNPFRHVTYDRLPEFAVIMAVGRVGFIPLFFVTATCGSALVLLVGKALGAARGTQIVQYIGKHTIEMVVINGAVFVLAEPFLARTPIVGRGGWAVWAAALTILQLAALPALGPAIKWLYGQCQKAAEVLAAVGASALARLSPPPALRP